MRFVAITFLSAFLIFFLSSCKPLDPSSETKKDQKQEEKKTNTDNENANPTSTCNLIPETSFSQATNSAEWPHVVWYDKKDTGGEIQFTEGGVLFKSEQPNSRSGIMRELNQDVSQCTSLFLKATIIANIQTLEGTGWQGREAPVAIVIKYTDEKNILHDALPEDPQMTPEKRMFWRGFYYLTPENPSHAFDGVKVEKDVPFTFIFNLMTLNPKPKTIHFLVLEGAGWKERLGTVKSVSLLQEEPKTPSVETSTSSATATSTTTTTSTETCTSTTSETGSSTVTETTTQTSSETGTDSVTETVTQTATQTETDIIKIDNFGSGPQGWVVSEWYHEVTQQCTNDEVTYVSGVLNLTSVCSNGHIGIRKTLDVNVEEYSKLYVRATLTAHNQTLSGTGMQGREAPVAVEIKYTDVNNVVHDALPEDPSILPERRMFWRGFYYLDPSSSSYTTYGGIKVTQNAPYTFEFDLMTLTPKPKIIHFVSLAGSGWNYRKASISSFSVQGVKN